MSRGFLILRSVFNALLAGGLLSLATQAFAASSDTITLSVTPGGVEYGVEITSPEVQGYDFAEVALEGTTISTKAIPVKNSGNIAEYFSLSISNTSPDNWTAIPSGVPAYNEFKLLGRLVGAGNAQPDSSVFDVNVDTITAVTPAAAAGRYGQITRTDPGVTTDLYLKLTMPNSVTSAQTQTMTITINGQAN